MRNYKKVLKEAQKAQKRALIKLRQKELLYKQNKNKNYKMIREIKKMRKEVFYER